ncbi:hypothetical protein O3Q52_20920 [Streptomyces sp. ActVer]|uniref:hypothetical protein n=1 Tax=Streptomyces sp. ActVer TaxID=3014558 RepID=UPI0022B40145|nr:hypothetical protein [Streptomyces sp. ActVer]MCZ4510606.1 hypothetical protein [Streptomyces sp. ActVer]
MSLSRTRSRTLAAVGFLAATGLFLTACGPEDSAGADASSPAGASASPDSSAPAPSGSPAASGGADASEPPAGSDGTFSGKLTFLAPGKLLVGERAFWVAEGTEITGGDICGDPETAEAEKCTADDLDAAAEAGNLTVEVTIKKGIAERVTQK